MSTLLSYAQRGQTLRYTGVDDLVLPSLNEVVDGLAWTIWADGVGATVSITPADGSLINGEVSASLSGGRWVRLWAVLVPIRAWYALFAGDVSDLDALSDDMAQAQSDLTSIDGRLTDVEEVLALNERRIIGELETTALGEFSVGSNRRGYRLRLLADDEDRLQLATDGIYISADGVANAVRVLSARYTDADLFLYDTDVGAITISNPPTQGQVLQLRNAIEAIRLGYNATIAAMDAHGFAQSGV